jgi:hypothetical protein
MTTEKRMEFDGGKYTLVWDDPGGRQRALRYGEEWRELTGDNLVAAMRNRIEELEGIVGGGHNDSCVHRSMYEAEKKRCDELAKSLTERTRGVMSAEDAANRFPSDMHDDLGGAAHMLERLGWPSYAKEVRAARDTIRIVKRVVDTIRLGGPR